MIHWKKSIPSKLYNYFWENFCKTDFPKLFRKLEFWISKIIPMDWISMYGVSLEVFLNVSSNRRFLENVLKLLGISSLKDSRIMSKLFRKLEFWISKIILMDWISMYGVSLEVFLNVSSNRRFLENVLKLLGISSLKDSRIMSSLEFFRKLKVLTENFQTLLAEIIKTLFPVLIQHTFLAQIAFHRIYTCFSKIMETFSQKQNHIFNI